MSEARRYSSAGCAAAASLSAPFPLSSLLRIPGACLAALTLLLVTSAYAQPASEDAELHRAYSRAVRHAIRAHWMPPDEGVSGACPVLVRQLPGGEVLHVEAHHGCTFDEAGRRSVEAAVWAASPLPYHGYERVFAREMRVTVRAEE